MNNDDNILLLFQDWMCEHYGCQWFGRDDEYELILKLKKLSEPKYHLPDLQCMASNLYFLSDYYSNLHNDLLEEVDTFKICDTEHLARLRRVLLRFNEFICTGNIQDVLAPIVQEPY